MRNNKERKKKNTIKKYFDHVGTKIDTLDAPPLTSSDGQKVSTLNKSVLVQRDTYLFVQVLTNLQVD